MQRIETISDVIAGLDALCESDPRLVAVRDAAGEVPLRLTEPGFASLVSIIVSQQVSRASADAILARLTKLAYPLTAETIHAADNELFRLAGLSRPKQKTMRALAAAIVEDGLDLEALCRGDAENAMQALTAIHGIGRWTAEIYLMFAAGHPDIFPARDIALQAAVAHALGLSARPDERRITEIAESWAPNRGVAARLFWAYYREMKGREAAPAV